MIGWLAKGPVALEDESHHAIAQDQQITVRCLLARPLQPKALFPSASEGLWKTIKGNGSNKRKIILWTDFLKSAKCNGTWDDN